MKIMHLRSAASAISDRRSILLLLVGFAVATIGLMTLQHGVWIAHEGRAVPWAGLLKARIGDCFCYAVFMPLLCWLAWRHPIDRARWPTALPLYFFAALIIAFLKECLFVAIGDIFRPGVFVLSDILAEDYSSEVLNIWALIGIAHALAFHERYWRSQRQGAASSNALERLVVKADGTVRRIPFEDIQWVEAQGNYAQVNTRSGRRMIRETMRSLEERLGAQFLRVHRSIIVNVDAVESVKARSASEYWLILKSGARVPTGRSYKDKIRPLLR
jgi:hypothetical protein